MAPKLVACCSQKRNCNGCQKKERKKERKIVSYKVMGALGGTFVDYSLVMSCGFQTKLFLEVHIFNARQAR